jgi:hydroxymethylbilane synthase
MTLRIGTRGSALAVAQARRVATAIERVLGWDVELVECQTVGDSSEAAVAQLGVGVFVSSLREALLAKEIDVAIHSYKDLPTVPAGDLVIAAVPEREDPRDALVARDGLRLSELRPGATIGTGSPRRAAQLLALDRQLRPVAIRGNVDTRLAMVAAGTLDAVVVARAGLLRLRTAGRATDILDPTLMLPAPAQGALAVECREHDLDLRESLRRLDEPTSRAAVVAERAFLSTLGGGCSSPVAALANVTEKTEIQVRGGVFSPDGSVAVRGSLIQPATEETLLAVAEEIGTALATDLLAKGAETVLGVHNDPQP